MYIGAFDIGGTKTIIALADENGKIYEKKQWTTNTSDCFAHLDDCCEVFTTFMNHEGIASSDVAAIGVNLPGIVDSAKAILLRAVYAGWMNIPVKEYLSEKLGVDRIICENDVNSCAVGELRFGLGKDYKSFGWMTVSTGVGGAVVCDGNLIRGAHGYAGEFGHLKVEYDDPAQCPCGQKGCMEAQCSGTALGKLAEKEKTQNEAFAEAMDATGATSTGAALATLAKDGNQEALAIFDKVGEYLGRGIAYYANILDPEAMVIGGGVAASLDLLMPGIRKAIDRYTFAQMKDIKILPSALGYEAALMGAIAVAVEDVERR